MKDHPGISAGRDERHLLEGPDRRTTELFRALRIFREIIRGFRALHFVGPCATVFGSAWASRTGARSFIS
jgi:hypothetical protein